jgi:hypothetical protein
VFGILKRYRYRRDLIIGIVCCLPLICSGCALIVSGTKQKIAIRSDPPGATATVITDPPETNRWTVVTPDTVALPRNRLYRVTITKAGYDESTTRLNQGTNPWVWCNILFGGIIGCAIDYGTGASFELLPRDINVKLNQIPPSVTGFEPLSPPGDDRTRPTTKEDGKE